MRVLIDGAALRRELARRGWCQRDLAARAGLSCPTVSAAIAGRAVNPQTLKLIANAIVLAEPIDGIDALLVHASHTGAALREEHHGPA